MRRVRTTIPLFLLSLVLLSSLSIRALALNIDDQNLIDRFEYLHGGVWKDLNTVMYTDQETGRVGYCLEHEASPPRPCLDYVPYDPATMFPYDTIAGIQAILNHGYPADRGGLSEEDAFYATANAVRFWIKESCGQGYDFMLLSRKLVRSKAGGEDVWGWCMKLLEYARTRNTGGNGFLYLSTAAPKWELVGNRIETTVNISSRYGYSVAPHDPSVTVSGYTGGIIITAPASMVGTEVSLGVTAVPGSLKTVELGWYEPKGSDRQKLVFAEKVSDAVCQSHTIRITGEFYDLTVNSASTESGMPKKETKCQLLSNQVPVGLTRKADGQYAYGGSVTEFLTDSGTALICGLPAGKYQFMQIPASDAVNAAPKQSILLDDDMSVRLCTAEEEPEDHHADGLTGRGTRDPAKECAALAAATLE